MQAITKKVLFFSVMAATVMFAMGALAPNALRDRYLRPAAPPAPADNQVTSERVQLGKTLFFDPRLSGSNWISCATCHNPALGWSDGLPTGWGHGMKKLGRATPTILNTAFNPIQKGDGRTSTLEDQALGLIGADAGMNQPLPELVAKLSKIEGYRAMFKKAYPSEEISEATIAKAIASFERTIISTESPFDRWRTGDRRAIGDAAKRGFEIFVGKAKCDACHSGFNFTDNRFHNIGVKDEGEPDVGRFGHSAVASLKGASKTPTLRDIALTAPYMRNGIYRTLEEVVDHYDRGGDVKDNLSPEMKPLHLTAQEKADLVEFMKSLTGKPMQVALPHLPQ